ncbi:uncharacterized protein LOC108676278, partial [Hyalella azteca]|uniref:Uncharacterized protein LOC108676278 n=1 Tax=Hyalella azteca TaxID=294128 RepID=A0A8B7P1I2_HYAAZ
MEAKLALIKSDKLNGLAEQLKDCSIEEQLQVLRYSSRCAFDKNSVGPDLLVIVSQACNRLASAKDFNLVTYYKSLYYIIQVAAKKDELLAALQLLPYISQLINHGHVNAESTVFIKSMYQLAWNLSLRCPDPVNALKLQQHSLIFLLSCDPNSLSKVVALAEMTASNFSFKAKSENSEMCGKFNSSSENTEGCCTSSSTSAKNDVAQQVVSFYHQILSSVLIHISKSGTILPADVIDVITLLSSCAIHQHTNVLKYSLKTLKSLCNQECYSAMYTGLQTLLAALKVQHFDAEAVSGLDAALGMVKQYHSIVNVDDGARKVALHCLLCVLAALEDRDSQDATYLLSSIAGLEQTLSLVLTYCTPDADSSIKLK